MGKAIGIDLGTTNSCVAVIEGGKPIVIENDKQFRTIPSIVGFTEQGERLIGHIARHQAVANPQNTIFSIKRLIGRKFFDPEVKKSQKIAPYKIVEISHGDCGIEVKDKKYPPPEISAMLLQKMKQTAEDYLNEEVTEAVITVPAYFNDSQRQATKDAGRIAGLNVLRIINEPTAASLAYGLNKKKDEIIAVYDLGGGTFDLSILEIGNGVFEVKSTNGDTFLGGDDIDAKIIAYLAENFRKEHGVDLRKDQIALQRLKEAAEKAKCELSYSIKTNINLPFITTDEGNHKHLNTSLTRAQLEQMAQDLIDRTIEHCKIALKDAKLTPDDIDEVILVGGQTRMPLVQETVKKFLGKEAHKNINPDEVVAVGAAIQGGILKGEIRDIVLVDVTPLSLGIETLGGIFTKIINKNSTIPLEESQMFTTAVDNQASVSIHVLQGERDMAVNNKSLGLFDLVGIPPAPKNKPQIEVTFRIDANGIVNVSAEDIKTGLEHSIQVNPSSGLTEKEIQQMVKDAKSHIEEDRKKKKLAELRNEADSFISQTEKWLLECEKELSDPDEKRINEALTRLTNVQADDDPTIIDTAIDELSKLMNQIDRRVKI